MTSRVFGIRVHMSIVSAKGGNALGQMPRKVLPSKPENYSLGICFSTSTGHQGRYNPAADVHHEASGSSFSRAGAQESETSDTPDTKHLAFMNRSLLDRCALVGRW